MFKVKNQKGFTLVELMVVVAIIGILSAVAIPQFQTYQAKSRTSEAKLALAGVYSAQIAFQGEADIFHSCLFDMGYKPASLGAGIYNAGRGAPQRYYNVGLSGGAGLVAGVANATVNCAPNQSYNGTKGGNVLLGAAAIPNTIVPTNIAFRAGAAGRVDTNFAANTDTWSINQDKLIVHHQNGY